MTTLKPSPQKKGYIEINTQVSAPFLSEVTDKKTIVLFFGYVGCINVCTPVLENLHKLHRDETSASLREKYDIVFINLLSDIDPSLSDNFAKGFDDDFKGVYLDAKKLRNINRAFKLAFSPSILDKSELNHTDYIYLLHHEKDSLWELERLYFTNPLNTKQLIEDIKRTFSGV